MNSTMEDEFEIKLRGYTFEVYVTWGGLLIIKMLLMSLLTGVQRARKGAFENEEDQSTAKGNFEIKKDESVERVRRAHLNDLENCVPFLIVCGFYVASCPHPTVASWLIRTAVLARFLHTIVYALYPIRQPARSLCFFTCLLITLFMLIFSIVNFFHF